MAAMVDDRALVPSSLPAARPVSARRRLAALAIAAIATLATVIAVPGSVGATAVDVHGDELMRLTNLDRGALGKPALAIDPTLAAFARDMSWTCPTNSALVLRGRAADMADRAYFDHSVPGCLKTDGTAMNVLDVMGQALGYLTTRGENIAWNTYGTGAATYGYGCALDGTGCAGTTPTITTVEVAQRGFMQSSGHRSNILSGYDRFGCGSALAADGRRYYACVFSLGGPASVPAPTPAPTPVPTTSPIASLPPTPSPLPSPAPVAPPTPTPTIEPDTTKPAFGRLTGVSPVRAGLGRTIGATVADNRALRRLEVYVDGRLTRTWTLSGTGEVRSVLVPSSRLTIGRHLVRWTVRDAAGNYRSASFYLYVR